jgi:hypothetical protein
MPNELSVARKTRGGGTRRNPVDALEIPEQRSTRGVDIDAIASGEKYDQHINSDVDLEEGALGSEGRADRREISLFFILFA